MQSKEQFPHELAIKYIKDRVKNRRFDPELKEDYIQEAYIFCLQQWPHYDPSRSNFQTWVYRMTMYGIGTFRRRFNRNDPVRVPQNARKKFVPVSCSHDSICVDPKDVSRQLDIARCLKAAEGLVSKESMRAAKGMIEAECRKEPAKELGLTPSGVGHGFNTFLREVTRQAKILGLRDD